MQNRNSNKSIERSLFFHEISKTQLFNNLFVLINTHTHTHIFNITTIGK